MRHYLSKDERQIRAEEMYELYCAGASLGQIGEVYEVSRERVRQIIKRAEVRYGLPPAKPQKQAAYKEQAIEKKVQKRLQQKERRRGVRMQSKHYAPLIHLDAHLVKPFLLELGETRVPYYRDYGRKRTPNGTCRPSCIEFRNGARAWKLHLWVLSQYGSQPKPGEVVHTRDGDYTNALRENLDVMTRKEYGAFVYQHYLQGHTRYANGRGRQLRFEDAQDIRVLYAQGYSQAELARIFEVNSGTVWAIVHNQAYLK